jgi:hypothetical protein
MSINLQLKKFDLRKIKDDKIFVVLGKRHTGKSFLTKEILYYHRDIPTGVVLSPTENANHYYQDFVPKIFIHDEYNQAITANFMKRQKKMKQLIRQGDDIDNRAFIIFDDCLYDKSWKTDKFIREIFFNGRHWSIFAGFLLQYPMGISPELRSNIDFVFIFRENVVANRKRLYEQYAGMFPTFEMFCKVMDQCTENFECLVIDNTIQSNKIEDQVYWYKSEDHGEFKMCPPEIWEYSEKNYMDDNVDDEININTYYKPSRGPKLNVKKL